MPKRLKATATCDLCYDSLEKGQDIRQCEGDCGCTVHRYCAGVTKKQFEDLRKGPKPFVCQWCSLATANAVIQQLQADNDALKLELCEAKRLLTERPAESQSRDGSVPTHASPNYASAVKSRSKGQQTQRQRLRRANPTESQVVVLMYRYLHQAPQCRESMWNLAHQDPRRRKSGARRVWGTFADATTRSVKAALKRVFTRGESEGDELHVLRKFKPGGSGRKTRWWFVLRSSEPTLVNLESRWESMELQTGWKLSPATDRLTNATGSEQPKAHQSATAHNQSDENKPSHHQCQNSSSPASPNHTPPQDPEPRLAASTD